MYAFSRVLLEFTLDRAAKAVPRRRDPRVSDCVTQIRQYMDEFVAGSSRTQSKDLAEAVNRLAVIAFQHHEVLIASRLQQIALHFDTSAPPLSKRQPRTNNRAR